MVSFRDSLAWAADAYVVKSSNLDVLMHEIERVLLERQKKSHEPVAP